MSLDKGIKHGKEKRKPYYGAASFDVTCRPHGGSNPTQQCPWCRNSRLLWRRRFREIAQSQDEINPNDGATSPC